MESLWEAQSVWASIGMKVGSKCELKIFMHFIATRDIWKTPHLNLAHFTGEPTSLGKRWTSPIIVHIFCGNCHVDRQLVLRCSETSLDLLCFPFVPVGVLTFCRQWRHLTQTAATCSSQPKRAWSCWGDRIWSTAGPWSCRISAGCLLGTFFSAISSCTISQLPVLSTCSLEIP